MRQPDNQPLQTERPMIQRRTDWLTLLGPYIGLLFIIALFSYLTWTNYQLEQFLSLANLRLITLHASVIALVAIGMTMIMISGGIDLSVGYVVSLVTVVTVLVHNLATGSDLTIFHNLADVWAIAAGFGVGMATGLCNGLVITKLRVIPFVATLGMMGIARGLGQYLADGRRVAFRDSVNPPDWVLWLRTVEPQQAWLIFSPTVWSVIILATIAVILLNFTVLGRHCYAIGANEAAARMCGIHVDRTKIIIYVIAGLATAWAGIVQTARSAAGTHDAAAGLELEVIAAVVIGGGSLSGGKGTIVGTLVGALILAVLENGCTQIDLQNEYRFMVIGALIIGVAALNQWRERKVG